MNARPVLIGCGALAAATLIGGLPSVVVLALLTSYGRAIDSAEAPAARQLDALGYLEEEADEAKNMPTKPKAASRGRSADKSGGEGYGGAPPAAAPMELAAMEPSPEPGDAEGEKNASEAVSTRQWFPEAFLWSPFVETSADGVAVVDVRVPDQLTTWRVLGLAHDRGGQQAGAVHTFDSRLPVYVEPVVPGWLYAGDTVALPIQAVNTTDEAVDARLVVEATGAMSGGGEAMVALGASGSDVHAIRLVTNGAGAARIKATLLAGEASDAAEREIPILPAGRPVETLTGGSVTRRRALTLDPPAGADPATQELTIRVFPGPLAVLQVELERLAAGATPADAAYGFALSTVLTELAARAGVEADPKAVRKLQLVAWQQIARVARAPDAGTAADLLVALANVEDHALVDGLGPRLVHTLVREQRGDGTWARQPNAPLQQVLIQTALAARALPEDQVGARLRAAGAIERYAREISDPYTAAVVLASGLPDDDLAERLVAVVVDASTVREDGSRSVVVPPAARNAWGQRPTRAELLAWTALALADRDVPWKADLVAELMTGYDARRGFGAGRADAVAIEAVARMLPGATAPVDVLLLHDGVEVARASVDPRQPMVPAVLVAAPGGSARGWELHLASEVPGLSYVAQLASWVPWSGEERLAGVEVEVKLAPLALGRDSTLTLTLVAPSGTSLEVEQGLPAGVAVDEAALAALSGLTSWDVSTDRVRLVTRPFRAGEILELALRVRPAFAGTFQTVPLTLDAGSAHAELAPALWTVQGGPG